MREPVGDGVAVAVDLHLDGQLHVSLAEQQVQHLKTC